MSYTIEVPFTIEHWGIYVDGYLSVEYTPGTKSTWENPGDYAEFEVQSGQLTRIEDRLVTVVIANIDAFWKANCQKKDSPNGDTLEDYVFQYCNRHWIEAQEDARERAAEARADR